MKNKIIHFGKVDEAGKLTLNQPKTFKLEVKATFTGKSVKLTVETISSKRSVAQNNYYYAVIVPRCMSGYNRLGWQLNEVETHQKLAKLFLLEIKVNQQSGEVFEYVPSTADLTWERFSEYIEQCINYGAMELDEIIPYPDEK